MALWRPSASATPSPRQWHLTLVSLSLLLLASSFFYPEALGPWNNVTFALHLILILLAILGSSLAGRRLGPLLERVPGPKTLGIALNAFRKRKLVNPQVLQLHARLGFCRMYERERIFKLWWGFKPIVAFFKPETVEVILRSRTTIDKAMFYSFLHPWLGSGLLTSTGSHWKTRRKLLTPAFHFRILDSFLPVINEQSDILVEKIQQISNQQPWLDIVPLTTFCALDIICETAMGVQVRAQENSQSPYVKAISEVATIIMERVVRVWLWPDIFFGLSSRGRRFKASVKVLHAFTRKVIRDRKAEVISSGIGSLASPPAKRIFEESHRLAFLDLLIYQHLRDKEFTEEDIREEVDTFMFAGHDTTAMSISWALYLIGLHPEIQAKLQDELDSLLLANNYRRTLGHEDLKQLKYMECVIKETLRLFPSVPSISRDLREDITVNGFTIPKGTICSLNLLALHYDPENFPEPDVFDPDRFLAENSVGRHPYAFVPFSAGPRNCIGQKFALMEAKVVVANILRHFVIESLDPRDRVHCFSEIILRPDSQLRLRFTPRNPS